MSLEQAAIIVALVFASGAGLWWQHVRGIFEERER